MKTQLRIAIVAGLGGLSAACGGGGASNSAHTTPEPVASASPRVAREPLRDVAVVAPESTSPIVAFRVSFDAGSADDPAGQEGVTNLAAELMSEGGAGDLTYAQLKERLFPMAAELDVSVGRDQTTFIGRVHRDNLDAFYRIFLDVLAHPRMQEADFTRLRTRALNALTLELRGNDDEELGKEMLQAMVYEGHPYGHPTLGTERGLNALTLEQVRAQRARVFCAGRATVGVAGAVDAAFVERVRSDVAAITSDACEGRAQLPVVGLAPAPRIVIIDKPEADSIAVSMGMPISVGRGDPDYAALTLAAAYFGQHRQFAGRLMQAMRGQRGLNYGDYAYAEFFEQEGWGVFPQANIARRQQYFSMWLRPVEPRNAQFAIRMAVRELHNLVENGISQADFERIRSFIDGYYALFLQTESRRLGFAIDDRFYGASQPWLASLRAQWQSMTAADVNAAIRRHIQPRSLLIAVIAPHAQELADAIAADGPSPITYPAEKPPEVLAEDREIQAYPIGVSRDRIRIVPLADVFR